MHRVTLADGGGLAGVCVGVGPLHELVCCGTVGVLSWRSVVV